MNQAMLCGRALYQINRFNEEMEFFMNEEAIIAIAIVRSSRKDILFQENSIVKCCKTLSQNCSALYKTMLMEMSFQRIDSRHWQSEDRLVNDDVDDRQTGMHGNDDDDERMVAGCEAPEAGVDWSRWCRLRCYSHCSLQTSDGPLVPQSVIKHTPEN